ncbi:MAG TPA: hypothetical protein VH107_11085 [Lacipirellulaceae bacterium]|jgi:hypothetical protein|nr:hypothetical protein [Lacipirellulaceae bacterium]
MNHLLANSVTLLAQTPDDYRVWGRFDHQPVTNGIPQWMLIFGVTAILLAIIALVQAVRARRARREFWHDSPKRLFQDLCRAHRLRPANRRLLKKIAAARGVEYASELFVEPRHFEEADLPATLAESTRDVRQLRHALFD